MSKSSSNDLHELIYSLSTGEIVYFKKYAKRYCEKESVYLKLFDSIKSPELEITPIFLGATSMLNKQRFAEHKWYLYNLILESLTSYHKKDRLDFQVRDMISKAILLMNKKLFTQAIKIIEQAKELTQKNNLNFVLNELLALEGTINMEIFKEPNIINYFKDLFTTCRNNNLHMNKLTDLLEVRYVAKSLYCKYGILTHIVDKETLDYCYNKLDEINRDLLSPIEQLIYDNNSVNLYAYGKPESCYHDLFTRLKSLYENNIHFIQQHPHNYLYIISNSITRYLIFNNKVEVQNNLDILREMNKSYAVFNERYFSILITSNIFYYELVILLKDKDNEHAYTSLKNMKQELLHNIETLPIRIQLRNYYLFGLICFYNNKFNETLDWFTKIFNHSNARLDLQLLARMYEIACHVELKNNSLVTHKLVALSRFSKKQLSAILQVNFFIKTVKLFFAPVSVYKTKKIKNHLESNLIALCKEERIDKFGFDIVIYCIMKNNNLSFSDAFDFYNCNMPEVLSLTLESE
jgi:hypothetical protein